MVGRGRVFERVPPVAVVIVAVAATYCRAAVVVMVMVNLKRILIRTRMIPDPG